MRFFLGFVGACSDQLSFSTQVSILDFLATLSFFFLISSSVCHSINLTKGDLHKKVLQPAKMLYSSNSKDVVLFKQQRFFHNFLPIFCFFTVRPSIRPSVRPSVCSFIRDLAYSRSRLFEISLIRVILNVRDYFECSSLF